VADTGLDSLPQGEEEGIGLDGCLGVVAGHNPSKLPQVEEDQVAADIGSGSQLDGAVAGTVPGIHGRSEGRREHEKFGRAETGKRREHTATEVAVRVPVQVLYGSLQRRRADGPGIHKRRGG
jgi:hypothetical protein